MLRLTRLNKLALFTMGRLTYFHIRPQWADYLGVLIDPAMAIFAVVSTMLNSMQVGLAVDGLGTDTRELPPFAMICRVVSLGALPLVTIFLASVVLFSVAVIVKELAFGRSLLRAKQKSKAKAYHAVGRV
ncbi:hypothetical protein DL771_004555 [Monosporascus sp. 5C6A]|nr:hypothetical protein DL771_004555 [Monosporascus sp. 5C6A]